MIDGMGSYDAKSSGHRLLSRGRKFTIMVARRSLCLNLYTLLCIISMLFFPGCSHRTIEKGTPFVERISLTEIPAIDDDKDLTSFKTAIERSLTFFGRIPGDRVFSLGDLPIPAKIIKESLLHLLKLIESGHLNREDIDKAFNVYRYRTIGSPAELLVTGYYEPILQAGLEPDRKFRYPVYGMPPDILEIELSAFDPDRFAGEHLVGRLQGNRVVPYYSRAEIDGQGKLAKAACELAWLEDPVDVFFLQVQGSGILKLRDGRQLRIGYAGANGRPYKSVGKYLIEKGIMTSEEVSLQSIRSYLKTHPEVRDEVLWYNESYVFFRWVAEGPMGSINVPLTAGRSIATDSKYYPRGAPGFLVSEEPELDASGAVVGWKPLRRWVLNQDTGGAIKGPGRVDLFCGSGETAERVAGRLKHPGALYIFVKK